MRAVAILAVLPDYRLNFVRELQDSFAAAGDALTLVAGDTHLDQTVTSAEFAGVVRVQNRALLGRRLLWQSGVLSHTTGADVVVVDLNPRSLTSWAILLWRKIRKRRTLVWGHILPRRGAEAITAPLRRRMRRLADGVISYTWSDAQRVRDEDSSANVWVAANGLYPSKSLVVDHGRNRYRILYVGRMEPAKKPALALEAFARAKNERRLPGTTRLTFVGTGSQLPELQDRAHSLQIADHVEFLGHVSDQHILRRIYAETAFSISPGYVGLSLTQSLGFGVPMLVADKEPHAPEVELLTPTTGRTFAAGDIDVLASEMGRLFFEVESWDRAAMIEHVRDTYSSTAMALGFEMAIRGTEQRIDDGA